MTTAPRAGPRVPNRTPGLGPPGSESGIHWLQLTGLSHHRRSKVRLIAGSASKIIAPSPNLTFLLSVLLMGHRGASSGYRDGGLGETNGWAGGIALCLHASRGRGQLQRPGVERLVVFSFNARSRHKCLWWLFYKKVRAFPFILSSSPSSPHFP